MIESSVLALTYLNLKQMLIESGYADEIDWCADLDFERTTETDFLREAAWVVLSSGFRESVVRTCFRGVSEAFMEWCSARDISRCREQCERRALETFGNRTKIRAIGDIVGRVAVDGYERVKRGVRCGGLNWINGLPFMGPTTSFHFAKNIGMSVVKPDRHLVRIAERAGRESPLAMCSEIAEIVGDRVSVVDLVFWRYATLDKSYRRIFEGDEGACKGFFEAGDCGVAWQRMT